MTTILHVGPKKAYFSAIICKRIGKYQSYRISTSGYHTISESGYVLKCAGSFGVLTINFRQIENQRIYNNNGLVLLCLC